MQGMGISSVRTWGYFPFVTAIILCQKISLLDLCSSGDPWGTLFSSLQETTHAWHPTHLSRSITMPHFAISALVSLTVIRVRFYSELPTPNSELFMPCKSSPLC